MAISDYKGSATLLVCRNWSDGGSILSRTEEAEKYQEIEVPVDTLDNINDQLIQDQVRFNGLLWLDCEGSELTVLEGGEKFIHDHIIVINIEQTGRPRGDDWPTPFETHEWILNHGFLQAWTHTHRAVRGQFDSIYVRPDIFKPEFCCCLDSINRFNNMEIKTYPQSQFWMGR